MSQERDDQGQFAETVSLADVLQVFDRVSGPVVTSGDVADETGCSRDSARRKLERLAELGRIEGRKTAGRVVYWRTDPSEFAPVDGDDPLFEQRPSFASGRGDLAEHHDEVLYGTDG